MPNIPAKNRKAKYGPNIVRAWFDTVFQPMLRGLASERAFLVEHNWTWRFNSSSLEYIGPVRARLAGGAADNLDQFLSFHPQMKSVINEHDVCIQRLQDACQVFQLALVEHPRLHQVYREIAVETPAELGSEIATFFGAFRLESDFIGILAEYIVNNIESLPSHYATAPLWNKYRARIVAVTEDPALAAHKEATMRAGQELLRAVDKLDAALRQIRSELSIEFDVPIFADRVLRR